MEKECVRRYSVLGGGVTHIIMCDTSYSSPTLLSPSGFPKSAWCIMIPVEFLIPNPCQIQYSQFTIDFTLGSRHHPHAPRFWYANPDLYQKHFFISCQVGILTAVFVVVLSVNLLKGGGAFASPLGIKCGSYAFWGSTAFIFVWVLGVSL